MDCPYVFAEGRNGGSDSFAGATFESTLKQTQACGGSSRRNKALTQLAAAAPVQSMFGCRRRNGTQGLWCGSQGFSFRGNQ